MTKKYRLAITLPPYRDQRRPSLWAAAQPCLAITAEDQALGAGLTKHEAGRT